MAAKKTTTKNATAPKQAPQKMSAIDAAAKVLGESKEPLNTKEMVEKMSAKGYWKSPVRFSLGAEACGDGLQELAVKPVGDDRHTAVGGQAHALGETTRETRREITRE